MSAQENEDMHPQMDDSSDAKVQEQVDEATNLKEGEQVVYSYEDMNRLDVPEFEKNKGKEAFLKHEYAEAAKHYSKALLAFQFLVKDQQIKTKELMTKYLEDIEIPCNSNLGMCYLKLREYKQCIHFSTKVIDMDPTNVKAIYRRGMSHLHLSEFAEARKDFKSAFVINPTSKEIQLAFEQLQIKINQAQERQKQISKAMLDNLDYSDKLDNASKTTSEKTSKTQGVFTKIIKSVCPDFKQMFYNLRVTSLVAINFFSEKLCKRRIPSQYFNKDK